MQGSRETPSSSNCLADDYRATSPFEETVRRTPLGPAISVPSPRLLELIVEREPKP